MSTTLYQFTGEHLGAIEWCDPVRGQTLVADSWRVQDGKAVALERHEDRFSASAQAHGVSESTLRAFFSRVREHIPSRGSWFPRIEVAHSPGGPTLRYRERVAPAWETTVTLALGAADPRTHPLTKGPDLEALMALRASVADQGATEALIATPDGTLVEGAYSSVLAWPARTGSLVVTPSHLPRIPSITESVLLDIARASGVEVLEQTLLISDLEDAEVWIISALHGIRLATAIVDGPALRTDSARRNQWQSAWWNQAKSL